MCLICRAVIPDTDFRLRSGSRVLCFLLEIDTVLNNPGHHFVSDNRDNFDVLWEKFRHMQKPHIIQKRLNNLLKIFIFPYAH